MSTIVNLKMNQIDTIKEKLKLLKKYDPAFSIFGASTHRYRLNSTLTIDQVHQFENDHAIKLPDEYVQFMTTLGNGGAGPYYGLEPLQNCLYQDLDYKNKDFLLSPSQPFIHTSAWNMKFQPTVDEESDSEEYEKQYEAFTEEYYDAKYMNGVIAICNFGCAVSINLVVNGSEYGNIWTDDRSSDYGIHPSHELGNSGKITFLNWYEMWLDNSLSAVNNIAT